MAYHPTIHKALWRFSMPTLTARPPKSKITITLNVELVRQLDAFLDTPEAGSRSRIVEEALRHWLHSQARRDHERQIEEYYRSLSKAERKEDKHWSKATVRSARRLWD
jgi:metal-responsive CopG/Arc/MetJ family transcriptional regulator